MGTRKTGDEITLTQLEAAWDNLAKKYEESPVAGSKTLEELASMLGRSVEHTKKTLVKKMVASGELVVVKVRTACGQRANRYLPNLKPKT